MCTITITIFEYVVFKKIAKKARRLLKDVRVSGDTVELKCNEKFAKVHGYKI